MLLRGSFICGLVGRLLTRLLDAVLAVEPLHAARGIDEALGAGIKRMAFRANLDVKLLQSRARFKGVAACASYDAAAVFGMDSRFHFHFYSRFSCSIGYHRRRAQTILQSNLTICRTISPLLTFSVAALGAIVITIGALASAAGPPKTSPPQTTGVGFTPENRTLFAPVVELAPPGPARAARAIEIMDRQLAFQRKLSFHPEIGPSLQKVVDQLPPRQSTLIRAAALYSKPEVPWSNKPDGTHQISVDGEPRERDYFYNLAKDYRSPEEPACFSGLFGLKPAPGSTPANVSSVTGTLAGELMVDTCGMGGLVDATAATFREMYGDLKPPWDTAAGSFNRHDKAALERFHCQMPHLAAKFDEYFKFDNVLDEFNSPAGPIVLLNMDIEVRQDALKKYPKLYDFYRKLKPAVTENSDLLDSHNNYWMKTGFDHGHIHLILMVQNGRLTPFNAAFKPAGEGVALNEIERGHYRTTSSIQIHSMKMDFGLANLGFATDYTRDANSVVFANRMDSVPQLVAPPGIHKMMDLIAGEFLRALATGNGGMKTQLASRRLQNGMYNFIGGFTAQLNYSPTLELLARVGDAIAKEHDEEVRKEERAFGEELFDAFVADYNDARPAISALDNLQETTR
jgi:hypothetical protein